MRISYLIVFERTSSFMFEGQVEKRQTLCVFSHVEAKMLISGNKQQFPRDWKGRKRRRRKKRGGETMDNGHQNADRRNTKSKRRPLRVTERRTY